MHASRLTLMALAVGLIHDTTADFADIREITEIAAEARRQTTARKGSS